MKSTDADIQKKVREAFAASLQRVPFLRLESFAEKPGVGNVTADLLATVNIAGKKQRIIVEVKGNGQPRMAREAVNRLLRFRQLDPAAYGVFAAPYISPGAAEICAADQIGFLDLAGNCRLVFDGVYIEQEGKPNPFARKRDLRSLYSPKAERVLRVLLSDPSKCWRLQALADEASVSLGQASNVKKLLEDREWLVRTKDGLHLGNPGQLLSEWVENYQAKRNDARNYYTLKSVAETESDLAEVCRQLKIPCSLTGFSASARYAPTVRYQRGMAYVGSDLDKVANLLSLKLVPSGANFTLIRPYDAGVLHGRRTIGGIEVAAPIQVYLDLIGMKGRGEEAAESLLDEVIRKAW